MNHSMPHESISSNDLDPRIAAALETPPTVAIPVAMHAQGSRAAAYRAVEWSLAAEFILLTVWLTLRPNFSR